ncbi:MAG: citrate/2-methylcitrate synthase [Planctomycetota bacterium]|jgi:citrate synthase
MAQIEYAKGLEGVIAAESDICRVDGENGKLYYRGYSIEDLAEYSTYEQVTYLLLYEKLPTAEELADFSKRMRQSRSLTPPVIEMIRHFPKRVISYLSGTVEHQIRHSPTCNCRQTLHQISQLATVLATYSRFREGKSYIESREDLSHGANFLYLLRGEVPPEDEGRMMDQALLMHAEHGFNASTFTARVVASTLSTCYCSISAAIGALAGPLHGGANVPVLEMIDEIGSLDNVDSWIEKALGEKRKIMGMGHRVYKAKDPRAIIMDRMLKELSEKRSDDQLYQFLHRIENSFRARMETKGKPIYPNVDFVSGSVYAMLGIPRYLFIPIFAIARSAGWLAHILEQRKDNRIFRPRCLYVGPGPKPYIPNLRPSG